MTSEAANERQWERCVDTARTSSTAPREAPVEDHLLVAWHRADAAIEPGLGRHHRRRLLAADWKYVCHITKLDHLEGIAKHGLLPGIEAENIHDGDLHRESRKQSDTEIEARVSRAVCMAFWSPWWVPQDHGTDDSVIIVLDAVPVCTQLGTKFFTRPIFKQQVSFEDVIRNQNTTAPGVEAFNGCWQEEDPNLPVWKTEILGARVPPRHICHLIFPSKQTKDSRLWQSENAYERNWPNAASVEASVGRFQLSGSTALMLCVSRTLRELTRAPDGSPHHSDSRPPGRPPWRGSALAGTSLPA